jgi:foldase protein PrsA
MIMPRKVNKHSTKRSISKKVVLEAEPMANDKSVYDNETNYQMSQVQPPKKFSSSKVGIILILVILAVVLLVRKGYVIAAVVNGKPIFSLTLTNSLLSRFGKQTLEGMITEQLIYQEAAKAGVQVTGDELKNREDEMVKNIGADVKLDDLLKYQGMTREDFDNQVKLQLSVEKILGKDVNFSETQIDNFIATSSSMLVATESAAQKAEAKKVLTEQEINNKIQPWLLEIKKNAKILRML